MESAFGVEHGDEFGKGWGGLIRPAVKTVTSNAKGSTTVVDRAGTWALKGKRETSAVRNSDNTVKNASSGGGLTGRGKIAAGGAGATALGGGIAFRRRNRRY